MNNQQIADIFYKIADILEVQQIEWKPQAYRKAARSLEALAEDVSEINARGGLKALMEISGVGEALAKKIEEFLKTGKIAEYETLKKSVGIDLSKLLEIKSMGPKKAIILHKKLGIRSVSDLEKAAKGRKIAKLEGFGEKSEQDILEGIKLYHARSERMLLGQAMPIIEELTGQLRKLKAIGRLEIAGSYRRRRETIRDIDIIVTSENPQAVMDYFTSLPQVKRVLAKGQHKSMVILRDNIQADLRVFDEKSFGAALQYNTGGIPHSISLRRIAIHRGYKLNEYGLWDRKTNRLLASKTEDDIYRALGFKQTPPPELREASGEIAAGMAGKLPKLVDYKQIRGDLHTHTTGSDGSASIEEMASAAMKLGYEYLCISDHTKAQRAAQGLDEARLLKQIAEIQKINKQLKGFRLLAGSEVDILKDGELDIPDEILAKLDIVIASMHRGFNASERQNTEALTRALENKYVDILGHPTGELINMRKPYSVALAQVIQVAAEKKKCLEINAMPDRLDLRDVNIRKAIEAGVKLTIGTDAHSPDQMRYIELGVAQARRGWAEAKDIVNTYRFSELGRFFPKIM